MKRFTVSSPVSYYHHYRGQQIRVKMRKVVVGLLLVALNGLATAQSSVFEEDTILAELRELFSDGYPTVSGVQALKQEAVSRFDADDCPAALPALEEWAAQSNVLANLYQMSIEPFYSTPSSSRQLGAGALDVLVPLEDASNALKLDRNLAWIMMAECHVQLGDNSAALAYFSSALDLLQARNNQNALWERARTGLLAIIGHGGN